MKKAYFIGIAGKAMGSLAAALKDYGWEVLGSDKEEVYPPVSDYLQEKKIKYFKGYSANHLNFKPDLIIVGRSALLSDPKNPEYQKALKLGCQVVSYPEALEKLLIKENSVVVAGTYGKSTTTALISWILFQAGKNPSFLIGGLPLNFPSGVNITDSDYSVVEGDETPALKSSDPPKFMFYHPKYLVLTATTYDHPEFFKNPKDYQNAFKKLIQLLPENGILFFDPKFTEKELVNSTTAKKVSYSTETQSADYFLLDSYYEGNNLKLKIGGKNTLEIETSLIGEYARQNILRAVAVCSELGVQEKIINEAVSSFKGLKTHLEFLGEFKQKYFYLDIAQHFSKVEGVLQSLREKYPDSRIIAVFDPSATTLKYKKILPYYRQSFQEAQEVIVRKVRFLSSLSKDQRISGSEIAKLFSQKGTHVIYEPQDEKVFQRLIEGTQKNDVVVFLSSGGLEFHSLIEKVIKEMKKKNE